jgi:predicted MFS family arabinose efflux permease
MSKRKMFEATYKRYVLGILTLVLTINFVDRGLMMLLLEPIKNDLNLSDTQLGLLTGIAFGLFYATLGLPIARLADRRNRTTITSIAIGLWGLTVMLCLFVRTFSQLVVARVAAAVGESGCMPPTYSLVGAYFSEPAERTRAMSIYWLASPFSQLISFLVGSRLNERFGWRITFFLMGIPALLVAVLVKLTIAEPRVDTSRALEVGEEVPSILDVLTVLWRQRSSRHLSIAIILTLTLSLGLHPWYAAFMMRSHGMLIADVGVWLGLVFGIGGIAGVALGGYVAGHWFAKSERAQMRLSSVMTAALGPCFALFLLLPQRNAALISLIPLVVVWNIFLGPSFALMQRLVVEEMRATTLAVVMLLANLIGMGVGPQIVGILSDQLRFIFGAESLRYSMLMMSFVALLGAYHFWRAGESVDVDLSAINRCMLAKGESVGRTAVKPASSECTLS